MEISMSTDYYTKYNDDFKVISKAWIDLNKEYYSFPLLLSVFRRSLLEDRLSRVNPISITGVDRSKEILYRWNKKIRSRATLFNLFSPRKVLLYLSLLIQIVDIYILRKSKFSVISYIHKTPLMEVHLKSFFIKELHTKVCYLDKTFISFISSIVLLTSLSKRQYRIAKTGDIESIFNPKDKPSCLLMEKRLRRSISIVKFIFLSLRVKLIITHDAHSHTGIIIAHAAKEMGVKVVEVAHGYTQDEALLTIFPLFADYEVVWGDLVRSFIINKTTSNIQESLPTKKILSFSQLVRDSSLNYKSNLSKKILFLVPSVKSYNVNERSATFIKFSCLICDFVQQGYQATVRLHPSDFDLIDSYSELSTIKEKSCIDISKKANLDNFDIVVGGMSSLLYEAAVFGLLAFQLTDYPGVIIQGSIPVTFSNCLEKVSNNSVIYECRIPPFRVKEFNKFFLEVCGDL